MGMPTEYSYQSHTSMYGKNLAYRMSRINQSLVLNPIHIDVHRQPKAIAALRLADVHTRADDSVLCSLSLALLARNELERTEEAGGIAHREELLGVLAVTLASERGGHGEAKLEPGVVVGLDGAVTALAGGSRVRGVLVKRIGQLGHLEIERQMGKLPWPFRWS
jgi:hypothetical protein